MTDLLNSPASPSSKSPIVEDSTFPSHPGLQFEPVRRDAHRSWREQLENRVRQRTSGAEELRSAGPSLPLPQNAPVQDFAGGAPLYHRTDEGGATQYETERDLSCATRDSTTSFTRSEASSHNGRSVHGEDDDDDRTSTDTEGRLNMDDDEDDGPGSPPTDARGSPKSGAPVVSSSATHAVEAAAGEAAAGEAAAGEDGKGDCASAADEAADGKSDRVERSEEQASATASAPNADMVNDDGASSATESVDELDLRSDPGDAAQDAKADSSSGGGTGGVGSGSRADRPDLVSSDQPSDVIVTQTALADNGPSDTPASSDEQTLKTLSDRGLDTDSQLPAPDGWAGDAQPGELSADAEGTAMVSADAKNTADADGRQDSKAPTAQSDAAAESLQTVEQQATCSPDQVDGDSRTHKVLPDHDSTMPTAAADGPGDVEMEDAEATVNDGG